MFSITGRATSTRVDAPGEAFDWGRNMSRNVSVLAWAGLFVSLAVGAFEKPDFPRLGGFNAGSPQNYEDPAYQEKLARLDIVVLNNFPGWESAHGTTMQNVVTSIKARNSRTLVFSYIVQNEVNPTPGSAWNEVRLKLDAERWWLYKSGSTGEHVESTWPGVHITNYTLAVPTNSSGERFVDWYARWTYQKFLATVPALDGAYTDNFFWKPRVNGDWNRDGIAENPDNAEAQRLHRQGMRRHIEVLRGLMPERYQIGNIGGWGASKAVYPEYEGLLHGGVLEHYIGESWSPEGSNWKGQLNTWGSWKELMQRYRKVMNSVAEPKLVIFNQLGDPRDYQAFRYGFASCLMDDAYYQMSDATGPGIYSTVPWFDEYDVSLGDAITQPPTSAWLSGVYKREFENGIVLVNPRGNGDVEVDLGQDFRRVSGSQDPSANNGLVTRRVRLKDRDGIVLLRLTTQTKPNPPSSIKAE